MVIRFNGSTTSMRGIRSRAICDWETPREHGGGTGGDEGFFWGGRIIIIVVTSVWSKNGMKLADIKRQTPPKKSRRSRFKDRTMHEASPNEL